MYRYLDTLLAYQTARKASPPIIHKVAIAKWRTTRVIMSYFELLLSLLCVILCVLCFLQCIFYCMLVFLPVGVIKDDDDDA